MVRANTVKQSVRHSLLNPDHTQNLSILCNHHHHHEVVVAPAGHDPPHNHVGDFCLIRCDAKAYNFIKGILFCVTPFSQMKPIIQEPGRCRKKRYQEFIISKGLTQDDITCKFQNCL